MADGQGHLAAQLAKWYKVRVIEAKPRQRVMRKRVRYHKGWFTSNAPVPEDIIVAMHPDEATWPAIEAARKNKKPWAVVPCCIKGGLETHGISGFHSWLNRLSALAGGEVLRTRLKMNGKNIVLWSRR